ncbi:MAG: metallophosphoesterase [Deltaproteobacteria bacterium]|nr:metallophosphoesterase [Deltaproteobacteria bacterium]
MTKSRISLTLLTAALAVILSASTCVADSTEKIIRKYTYRDNAPYSITLKATSQKNFVFAVVGDSGSGNKEQFEVANEILKAAPEFIIHTGDVVYMTGEWEHYLDKFVEPYEKLLKKGIPFYPVPGNHDYIENDGEGFRAYFLTLPNRYYTIKAGDIEFFMLDSNTIEEGDKEQLEWLETALKNSRAAFKIAVMHHPFYSSGFHGNTETVTKALHAIFEKNNVSLVLSGHDHDYERSKDGQVTHIVTGGGGAMLYNKPRPPHKFSVKFVETFHFLKVTVEKDLLRIQAIDFKGSEIDSFEIKPHR